MRRVDTSRMTDEEKHKMMVNAYMKELEGECLSDCYKRNRAVNIHYPYDPEYAPTAQDIDDLLQYFIGTEDYERCAKIRDYLIKKKEQ